MVKKHNKKLFIIDTNVLLHDYKCIYNFEENDVIIPIVVLEELDKFKKGNDQINFHAREFTRELDKLSGDMLLTANIPWERILVIYISRPAGIFPRRSVSHFLKERPITVFWQLQNTSAMPTRIRLLF